MKKIKGFSYIEMGIEIIIFAIVLFGIANVVNIKITNVISSKKDFQLLHSIGMSYQQIRTMVLFEEVTFGIISFALSGFLGNYLCKYLCAKLCSVGLCYFDYQRSYQGSHR